MNLRKSIKSIIALGTGLSMLGATVFGAVAQDLGDYPSNYIKDGLFNGLMVVGARAKTDDVLGVVDIATSLQYNSRVPKQVSGKTTTTLVGDAYLIGSSSDKLEMGESLGKVKSTITSDNLGALESTKMRTSKGSTDADQYLKFNSGTDGLRVVYEKNRQDDIGDFLKAQNGALLYTYELQFPAGLKSSTYKGVGSNERVEDGTAYLTDMEDEDLYILGDTLNIVEARITKDKDIQLTLMGGAVSDTLQESESKTYELNGKTYEVNVLIISDSSNNNPRVKFMINGEVTKSLSDGDTDTLEDGTVIGVKNILANEGAEAKGYDIVSFYLGANKIELRDGNYSDSSYTSDVNIDEENIEDAKIMIQATWVNDEAKITSIRYMLNADSKYSGDLFIGKNESLRELLDEPQGMLSKSWDVNYLGLSEPDTTTVEISPSGDETYYLDFTTQEDIEYSIPLVDVSNDGGFGWKFGDDENKLVFLENTACSTNAQATIEQDDYFIVSDVNELDKAFTHVLTFDNVDRSDGILTLSDVGDGSSKEVTFTPLGPNTCAEATTDLIVGGTSYSVVICSDSSNQEENYKLCVDLDNDGDIAGGTQTMITTKGGGIIYFSNLLMWNLTSSPGNDEIGKNGEIGAGGPVNMGLVILDKYTDSNTDQELTWTLYDASVGSSKQVDLDYDANPAIGLTKESDRNSDTIFGMTRYGIIVEESDEGSRDANSLTLSIPKEQVYAQVYVSGSDLSTKTTNNGATVYEYQRIEVGRAVLDSEISSISSNNLIVVGGPCVNTVAATLLGISSQAPACYENFPVQEGQGIIKMVEENGKVATLVAGYSALDTRKAAQVLANYADHAQELAGKDEIVVSGDKIISASVIEQAMNEEEPVEEVTNE